MATAGEQSQHWSQSAGATPSRFIDDYRRGRFRRLEHDPEKWKPVFRKDHAQTKR
jgi:hypothetical protein